MRENRKQLQGDREWEWGGCSDNTKYGEKETRRFIDRLEKGNDARTAFNLHNNQVGRKVLTDSTLFIVRIKSANVCRDQS